MRTIFVTLILSILGITACNQTAQTSQSPQPSQAIENVRKVTKPYGNNSAQKLDIYRKDTFTKSTPIMIYVHGGGWFKGSKNNIGYKAQAFNQAGYAFVSVEYPLVPEATVEQQAQSIAQAISFLVQQTNRKAPIYLMGHSAGAHLSALVVTDPQYLFEFNLTQNVVKAFIHLDSAALNIPEKMSNKRSAKKQKFADKIFGKNQKRWEMLSPFHNLQKYSSAPPFLLLTAEQHRDSVKAASTFESLLKEKNIYHNNIMIEDRSHSSINKKFGAPSDQAFQVTIDFINQLY
ncbi:MAG: alpha/beta hydrolase [Pseudomonadota bacterium]